MKKLCKVKFINVYKEMTIEYITNDDNSGLFYIRDDNNVLFYNNNNSYNLHQVSGICNQWNIRKVIKMLSCEYKKIRYDRKNKTYIFSGDVYE